MEHPGPVRSKFGKLVHLVGFIIKKFVTMHGHMNEKKRSKEIHSITRYRGESTTVSLAFFIFLPCLVAA